MRKIKALQNYENNYQDQDSYPTDFTHFTAALSHARNGVSWCFSAGRPRTASIGSCRHTSHYLSCWALLSLWLWPVDGMSLSFLWTYAHVLDLLTREHAAKCVLMRNRWSGSAQIKDILVRELPPVFPSCSAASKWVLLSLTPAGVARTLPSYSTCHLPS